jgi:hypothetical protein
MCRRCEDETRAQERVAEAAEEQAAAIRKTERARVAEAERQRAWEAEQARIARIDAEKNHFRPAIEQRIGHAIGLDDILQHERLGGWVAREERLAEILAARKALEAASGLAFAAVIDDPESVEWQAKDNLWGFKIPQQIAMGVYDKDRSWPSSDTVWAKPDDLLPYQAVSLYLNMPLDRIDWNNFAILPDGNVGDLTAAREYVEAKKENITLNFDASKNRWTGQRNGIEINVSPYVTIIPVYPDGRAYRFDYTTMREAGQGSAAGSKAPPPLPKATGGSKAPPPLPKATGGSKAPPPLPKNIGTKR